MNSVAYLAPQTESLFESRTIVELSDMEMMQIDGGTTPVCAVAVASSMYCVGGGLALAGLAIGYLSESH